MGRYWGWFSLFVSLAVPGSVAAQSKVALHPLLLPSGYNLPATVPALFDSLLTAELGRRSHAVVPSAESGRIWKQLVDSVQGFYDPITGDTVRAEFEAVRNGTMRHLATAFGATLRLRPSLEVAVVDWDGGKTEWDGTSERVSHAGKGTVPALSLVIVVEDSTGGVIATGRGGLRVLAVFRDGRFQPRAPHELFADEERNLKAVRAALSPFLTPAQTGR
jgi:hypothetical protein